MAVKFINKQSFKEIDDADRVFVEIQARTLQDIALYPDKAIYLCRAQQGD